jgi:hypothetical protein
MAGISGVAKYQNEFNETMVKVGQAKAGMIWDYDEIQNLMAVDLAGYPRSDNGERPKGNVRHKSG